MKQLRLSRRQFLQLGAFGAGALVLPAAGLAAVAAAPPLEALAEASMPQVPAITQPTFMPIASNTIFGALTDISMGWDGTLWGIDGQGAPHIYDAVNNNWAAHGDGIDAAGIVLDQVAGDKIYIFRGPEFVTLNASTLVASEPRLIAAQWPQLPDSFKQRIIGAMMSPIGPSILLFSGGRYVDTAGTTPPVKLTDLPNWPQSPQWKDGVIDGVFSNASINAFLLRGTEVVMLDLLDRKIVGVPMPLTNFFAAEVLGSWATTGVDTICRTPTDTHLIFKGAAVKAVPTGVFTAPAQYIAKTSPNWPATWHPILQHAPSGRDGNLWSVMPSAQGSYIVQHNGETWTRQPDQADHVSTGQDGTVMIASAEKIWRYVGNNQFTPLAGLSGLVQVSVGDNNSVWGRDANNVVHRFNSANNTFTAETTLGPAVHMAANTDGTLWHAKPNDGNLHRFLADSNVLQGGIPVKQGLVTTVSKVAATGFGEAHCLTQNSDGSSQAYRYNSPYVFKTATPYYAYNRGTLALGLGMVYFNSIILGSFPDSTSTFLVALDAHTGREISRSATLKEPAAIHGFPVFDPVNELVYVGTRHADDPNDDSTKGQLLALDARDLSKVVWSFTADSSIDAPPTLIGNTLFFSTRTHVMYAIDAAATRANPAQPRLIQEWMLNFGLGGITAYAEPVLDNGRYYTLMWELGDTGSSPDYLAYLWTFDLTSPQGTAVQKASHIFSNAALNSLSFFPLLHPPIITQVPATDGSGQTSRQLFFNGGDAIVAINLDNNFSTTTFKMPAGTRVNTQLEWDRDAQEIWFGDDQGLLYGLDVHLKPLAHMPLEIGDGPGHAIETTPVIYRNAAGARTVLVGVSDFVYNAQPTAALYGVDPDTGNIASIPTGVTMLQAFSREVSNGVLYVAGRQIFQTSNTDGIAQVFAIRVDPLVQNQRDFIIESQLMQDPDETATSGSVDPTNPIPPSVARYQTHITLVDDQKVPRANQSLKIWADLPNTQIIVNGQTFTIGPGDAQYAALQTGIDGSLVVMSTAKDVNTSPLRLWASFMNPYERIMVYPDHEWHARATQTYADPNADPNRPDPGKANLSAAHNFKGTALFTAAEKSQSIPQNVAGAIGQMNKGVSTGGTAPASLAGILKSVHASAASASYIAYTDLNGMHYLPSNARAQRTPTTVQPVGLQLTRAANGSHGYAPLSHIDARNTIDGLTGAAWDPANPNGTSAVQGSNGVTGVRATANIFSDFWNWLVGAFNTVVETITDVVVSIADDIMVGIRFIINGVETVFKAVVKAVEDVVNAIGSFFLQLEKLIEDVIEALSVLFHFGEIMWTHRWLRDAINHEIAGIESAITTYVKSGIDGFFTSGEDAIKGFFDGIRSQFGTSKINNLKGSGATAHSTYTVGPANQPKTSQAVPCNAGIQKFKAGVPAATTSSLSANARTQAFPGEDAITRFVGDFANRLSGDGDLTASFDQLKADFGRMFTASSASDFFSSALVTLLDILETLLVGILSVAKAFFDGLVDLVGDIVSAVMGVLNSPIEIPFISWLYKLLFNEDLTILNAVTLVAAIPVTIVFRVVEGQYPSQAGLPAANALPNGAAAAVQANGVRGVQDIPAAQKMAAKVLGVLNGVLIVLQGVCNTISDLTPDIDDPPLSRFIFGLGLVITGLSVPVLGADVAGIGVWDWASYGVTAFIALASSIGLFTSGVGGSILSIVLAVFNGALLGFIISAFVEDGQTDAQSDANFVANILSTLPGLINPLKVAVPGVGNLIVAGVDEVTSLIWGAITIEAAIAMSTSAVRQSQRLFIPWVSQPETLFP